ncbi:synaptotagmin-15-like [Macrosteles quadrilineatus]|uniref:synaptotagmin-15-like n=1 Tax=Macrosteles quadrilineatus TaxID=74068 RepID=UPI0023E0BA3B|nr:synaptotagmin-15-like [Macrosteles quadrilineatus]
MSSVKVPLLEPEASLPAPDLSVDLLRPQASLHDVVVPAAVVAAAVVVVVVVVLYKLCRRVKDPETDSLNPSIVVYPSYQGSTPQFLNKDIEFALPQLRHSESLDELLREPANSEDSEGEPPPLLVPRATGQRSNSFSSYGLGMIDPALYQGTLNFEEDLDYPEGHLGRVWFSLRYDAGSEKLLVSLLKVKNLPSRTVGTANNCDPVVRVWVTPNGRRYQQSRQKKKTCNPYYDETFIFQVAPRELPDHSLRMSVTDTGRTRRRGVIGHISFPLRDLAIESSATELTVHKVDLVKDTVDSISDLGEMLVSLLYNENSHRLTVSVLEAKNLKFPDEKQDSYVRLTLNQHYRTVKVKRTTTARGADCPKYSQGFNFSVPSSNMDVTSVILQVYQAGASYGKDKEIGKLVLGSYMFARGNTLTHWNTAFASPMEQIQQWHPLCA